MAEYVFTWVSWNFIHEYCIFHLFLCLLSLTPATFYWTSCSKPRKWTAIRVCAMAIDLASIYDFDILFLNCSDSVVVSVFLQRIIQTCFCMFYIFIFIFIIFLFVYKEYHDEEHSVYDSVTHCYITSGIE